jgi:UDP-glucose:(heptosyl)LPS alpha-1,3-glucosyltransferase
LAARADRGSMKIAIIRKECSFRRGGAERYAANLSRALLEAGHRVWMLAETCDADIHPDLEHVPVRVNRATSSSRNRSFHENSQKALASIQPEAVLALSRSFPADAFRVSDPLHRFWMSVRYPGALHRWFQERNPRHRTILSLEEWIFDRRNTRRIITNSRLSKTMIGRFFPAFPQERIVVAYNGVDLEHFSPAGGETETGGPLRLLFVGQDFKRKGLAPLLHALALLVAGGCACYVRRAITGRSECLPFRGPAGVSDAV